MDLRLIQRHLVEAERHVALSDKPIVLQMEIIDELARRGHPTLLALNLLHTYRTLEATHVSHRDTIRRELEG